MQSDLAKIDHLSLRRLITLIARQRSMAAWSEFAANRTPFRKGGGHFLLLEFLQSEAECQVRRQLGVHVDTEEICDIAFDRLGPPTGGVGNGDAAPRGQVARTPRWAALLTVIERAARSEGWTDSLTEELRVAAIVQRFVQRQVAFASREVRRNGNPARSRYRCQGPSSAFHVWMPRDISGRQRRRWLLEHAIGNGYGRDPDRQRVQAAIDAHFGTRRQVRLSDHLSDRAIEVPDDPVLALARKELADERLSIVVAREKARSVSQQRQAIRALGAARLEELVVTIFDSLAAGRFKEREVARSFGLSAPTMSRFAGTRWRQSGARPIPDLWANLAHLVCGDAMFRECAESAGVWPQVKHAAHSVAKVRCGECP